ncbi:MULTISPECIES: hypothetical protein [unclassified Variovorax]|uniref:hypothetical protein n=1 Tax=unclassified Variovorax TaxID=663243 RepID=UPI001319B850|nr:MULTISPECIES: hypothetical protein [unclassified Variovorax]VTU41871.1 hypothetical protein SRS16P1_00146 [Variovorax sp. SRS16]VTU41909.1 hypothetical protein E5P1_00146 [Variovorax sp. PBL-E5]VTU44547.1 hypothetical protein H6P1_00787 [Variovorax sp. PBL-H6]
MFFEKGTKVRFTAEALVRKGPSESKRYSGRTGEVTGYRMGAVAPIVSFPKDGRRKEMRLFEVSVKDLEVVPAAQPRQGSKPHRVLAP